MLCLMLQKTLQNVFCYKENFMEHPTTIEIKNAAIVMRSFFFKEGFAYFSEIITKPHSVHTAKRVHVLNWPAYSPGLSPTDNIQTIRN